MTVPTAQGSVGELTINALGHLGDGLAVDAEGERVAVPGALPGERVRVDLGTNPPRLCAILEPSPDRVDPPCPLFPRCGGCRLQHLHPEAVTAWKIAGAEHALTREGLVGPWPWESPVRVPWGSRRRVRLAVRRVREGVVLGFNAWHSTEVVDVDACPVAHPDLLRYAGLLRPFLARFLAPKGSCDVQMTRLPEGLDVVVVGGGADERSRTNEGADLSLEQRETLGAMAEANDLAQLSWRRWDRSPVEPLAHRRPLFLNYGGLRVPFPPGAFLQASAEGESALVAFAHNALAPLGGGRGAFLDLFSGLGAFGLSLRGLFHAVTCADVAGDATEALGRGTRTLGPAASLHVLTRNLMREPFTPTELASFTAVLFDPPRGGALVQARALAQSTVPRVVAISCDPPSFARDAKILIQGGYRLSNLQAVDQFLGSAHLELAALFEHQQSGHPSTNRGEASSSRNVSSRSSESAALNASFSLDQELFMSVPPISSSSLPVRAPTAGLQQAAKDSDGDQDATESRKVQVSEQKNGGLAPTTSTTTNGVDKVV